jgi:hypothetical protein
MDDLLRLARSYHATLSDPAFEAQCKEFNEILQSVEADFNLLHELQRVFFDFRNVASSLQILCGKINKRWPLDSALSLVADASEIASAQHANEAGKICDPQTFPGEFEHKCQNDRVMQTLLGFRVAAQNLNNEWQQTDGTHAIDTTVFYPFTEDFEDVVNKIITWTETTCRRVEGHCISCCDPDHAQCSLTAGCPCCDMRNSQDATLNDAASGQRVATRKKDCRGSQRLKKNDSS